MTDTTPTSAELAAITPRLALLKAAEHVEVCPQDFSFSSIDIPTACGSPGCALGWIAHFASIPDHDEEMGHGLSIAAQYVGAEESVDFYKRMDALLPKPPSPNANDWGSWSMDASICADILRKYADTYYPAETTTRD